MSNKNSLSYRRVGDYLIPNLRLQPEEARITLGRWGRMHEDYLKKNKRHVFDSMFMSGKLHSYLADIDEQAREMLLGK